MSTAAASVPKAALNGWPLGSVTPHTAEHVMAWMDGWMDTSISCHFMAKHGMAGMTID